MKTNSTICRSSETKSKVRIRSLGNRICGVILLITMLFITGCPRHDNREYLLNQIDQLTKEKSDLSHELQQTESEKEELKEQVHTLSGLPKNKKIENLYDLNSIAIGKLTNLYDRDRNGTYETLIVYLQTIDKQGDKIKIGGMADVQLWDLNRPDGQALLGAWRIEPEELKSRWVSFILTNYRLKFDVAELIDTYEQPLTVKVTFTDYLTGKIFREQKVIEPEIP